MLHVEHQAFGMVHFLDTFVQLFAQLHCQILLVSRAQGTHIPKLVGVLEQKLCESFKVQLRHLGLDATFRQLIDQFDELRDVLPQTQRCHEPTSLGQQVEILDQFHETGRADDLTLALLGVECELIFRHATGSGTVALIPIEDLSVQLLMSLQEVPISQHVGR